MTEIDGFDLKTLAFLQQDSSTTNQEIGEKIGLSASQVSRRRQKLEEGGVIRRYRAVIEPSAVGLSVTAFVGVALATHSRQNSSRFHALVRAIPAVQEAHMLTGDMDYLLKVVVKDLKALSSLINDDLLPHESVQNVRSFVAMDTVKDDNILPLGG